MIAIPHIETPEGLVFFLEKTSKLTIATQDETLWTNHPEQVLKFLLDELSLVNLNIVLHNYGVKFDENREQTK